MAAALAMRASLGGGIPWHSSPGSA